MTHNRDRTSTGSTGTLLKNQARSDAYVFARDIGCSHVAAKRFKSQAVEFVNLTD